MSMLSTTPAGSTTAGVPDTRRVLVWDAPVRTFHWLLVLSFAGAYITAEQDGWELVHNTLGYTVAGLVVFRLLWGLVGSRHARFASFIRGPAAMKRYAAGLLRGRPEHHIGHNPLGAIAIVGLLGLAVVVTVAGWATLNEIGGEWLEELHEGAANAMLALVLVHIAGVVVSSWLHRENLVRAMVTGRKAGSADEGIRGASRGLAALVLAAVLGFWALQWSGVTTAGVSVERPAASAGHHDDDDD